MFILLVLVELAAFICFIMVLIKQFQTAGPIHGIIGIITCGIWTFIWGWMNAAQLNIRNIMLIWTVLIVICLIIQFAFGVTMYPRYPSRVTRYPDFSNRKHKSAGSFPTRRRNFLECADQSTL